MTSAELRHFFKTWHRRVIEAKMWAKRHAKWVLVIMLFLVVVVWKCLPSMYVELSSNEVHELTKCPACYGVNLCPAIHSGQIQLENWSRFSVSKYLNAHNIFRASYKGQEVILKKLAHDKELDLLDEDICNRLGVQECDVRQAVHRLADMYSHTGENNENTLHHTKVGPGADMLLCPSQRKLDYIIEKVFANNRGQNRKVVLDNVLTMLLVNPESLLLQAFPASEGWPFPKYYGACGRIIAEEYVGPTLTEFREHGWYQRAFLAHQLLSIAQLLTENDKEFSLYVTDINVDNFAVNADGEVKIIDLENIIIVDHEGAQKGKHHNKNIQYYNDGYGCENCFRYSVEDLCSHLIADHNFYAVCQGILANNAFSPTMPEGLLHNIPSEVLQRHPQLPTLITECGQPSKEDGRFGVVEELQEILSKVKQW